MSKKYEGTFADWFINNGVDFDPLSVIVNVTEVIQNSWDKFNPYDSVVRPPFKHSFWEGEFEGTEIGANVDYLNNQNDEHIYMFTVFIKRAYYQNGKPTNTYYALFARRLIGFDKNGFATNKKYEDLRDYGNAVYIKMIRHAKIHFERMPDDTSAMVIGRILHSLHAMNNKSTEIELISDYPRQFRRRIERETGKEPSPYFMLHVHPDKPRKQYEGERPVRDPNVKSKMPETLVRGHVRIVSNHPIEHFNGVYWINAHTRGNKENGQIKKGYTIVLPKEKAAV